MLSLLHNEKAGLLCPKVGLLFFFSCLVHSVSHHTQPKESRKAVSGVAGG